MAIKCKKNNYFTRFRKIIKVNGWKTAIATVSAFTIFYFIQYIFNIFLSIEWSFFSALTSAGTIVYIYNAYCQNDNNDIKHALLLDWRDLPMYVHLLAIFFIILFFTAKSMLELFKKEDPNINNIKYIAYGN